MKIPTEMIKDLREQSGAGIMECRNALIATEGQIAQALEILKQQSLLKVEKKKNRVAAQGLVEAYVHTGGRVAALIELNCETDFVARTAEFKELAHNIAMQVTAMDPQCVSADDIPEGSDLDPKTASLLLQPYIKDQTMTVLDIINQSIARLGENVKVSRFTRFEIGD